MRRREFITLVGGTAVTSSLPARAQPKRLPMVALIFASAPLVEMLGSDPASPVARAFVHGLRDLGWIDGRNVVIERRSADGDPQRAPAIIAELLARGVDVVMLGSTRWLHRAMQQATRTIPIVAIFGDDPVAAGLIASLARPGGNLTGVTSTTGPDFYGKRLQLLHEIAPRVTRAAFLATREVLEQVRGVARPARIDLVPVEIERVEQFAEAFATIQHERADALMLSQGPVIDLNTHRILAFASEHRLPTIFSAREAVEAGSLMSYGVSTPSRFRQAARLVDKFLKGAKIGDIPTEQPTTFELVINAKTAQALGLTIPPTILVQADEVIE